MGAARICLAGGLLLLCLLFTSSAAASGFCESDVAYNYAQPLEEMPPLRGVPVDGRLPFGPGGVYLSSGSERQVMVPSRTPGEVGFALRIPFRSEKFGNPDLPDLNWLVTSKLARVDSRGRVTQLLGWRRKYITGPADNGGFALEFSGGLGYYRFEIVFRNGGGKRLGRFGGYFRVMPPVTDARLVLNAASYRPGETLSACLENFGTTDVLYGGCVGGDYSLYGQFSIQYFNGSGWEPSVIGPRGFCAGVGLGLGPGEAANLGSLSIPIDAPAGLYRAVLSDSQEIQTEFQILPPS